MAIRLVLGEPHFRFVKGDPWSTIGQMHLVLAIRKRCTYEQLPDRLREEYLAIGRGLKQLDPKFGIINLIPYTDQVSDDELKNLSRASIMLRTSTRGNLRSFPRDITVTFEKLWLINPDVVDQDRMFGDSRILSSPLGEGGMVLFSDRTALSCHVFTRKGKMHEAEEFAGPLREAGINFGTLPPHMFGEERNGEVTGRWDKHIDRVASLIVDRRGEHHLLVSRGYYSATSNEMLEPLDTLKVVRKTCDDLGIHVHELGQLTIPQAFAVVQYNGKVLMTSGDDGVAEVISDIVGSENIVMTEIPIEHYPAFTRASIRCLVGEFPDSLCNS